MTSLLRPEGDERRPLVPDSVSVPVAADATVLIVSDLHLRASTNAVTSRVENVLVRRLTELSAPAVVVLAGDIVEMLGEPGLRPSGAFAAHPELASAIQRIARMADCRVVQLVGNHDSDVAWDDGAADEMRSATGAELALTTDLLFDAAGGPCKVRVEHGNRFDPYNSFRDVRNPLDTPLGHHVVREILPIVTQVGPGWLDGAIDLADPPDFPSFVGSRLAYRRLAGHLGWLLIPLLLLLVVLRLPLVLLLTNRLPGDVQEWLRRSAFLGVALMVDVLVVAFLVAVVIRRSWQALRTLDLGERGYGQNNAARVEAARLIRGGYAGLVCGHSHRPELTAVGGPGAEAPPGQGFLERQGFFANSGSGTPVVEAVGGRFGMPPVYLRYLQVSWVEIRCTPELEVGLIVAELALPGATRLERFLAKRPHPAPRDPALVATWPGGRWP